MGGTRTDTAGPPERTPDGRYIVVKGRRWRASDPAIPEELRQELVDELMRARRLVRTVKDAARPLVNDAKIALGERGEPWWERTDDGMRERMAATGRTLRRHRAYTSHAASDVNADDVARVCGGDQWRDVLPIARDVLATLPADVGDL